MANSELLSKLIPILQKFAYEVETGIEEGDGPLDLSDQLIKDYGWSSVRDTVVQLLPDKRYEKLWEGGINVLYRGIGDGEPLEDKDYFIALMYACMKHYPGPNPGYEDTIWSLVMKLKKVGITSDYDPLSDYAVKSYF